MTVSYSKAYGTITWSCADRQSRWVIAGLTVIAIIFTYFNFASSLSDSNGVINHPAFNDNRLANGELWSCIGSLLLLMTNLVICLKPPLPGYFRISGGTFEFDSGRKSAYFFRFFDDVFATKNIFTMKLFSYFHDFFPRRTFIKGDIESLRDFSIDRNNSSMKIKFSIDGEPHTFIDDIPRDDIYNIFEALKEIIPPEKFGKS